ncbi:MAG TPA: STAS domain-containing protein [Streptomyces sp.]|nr:STAS domain-containing protein [Streptomyces sp.]
MGGQVAGAPSPHYSVTTPEPDDSGGAAAVPSLPQGLWVVTARGDLDHETCPALFQVLETAARMYPVVILDAARVTFGDLAFLNLLLRVHRSTTLRIAGPPTQIVRLMELTGADQILEVYGDLAAAVEA